MQRKAELASAADAAALVIVSSDPFLQHLDLDGAAPFLLPQSHLAATFPSTFFPVLLTNFARVPVFAFYHFC